MDSSRPHNMEALRKRLSDLSPAKLGVVLEQLKSRRRLADAAGARVTERRNSPAVLSCSQQRIWFVEQLCPGTPLFNQAMKVTVEGPLDVAVAKRALRAIVERHEILRSRFLFRHNRAVQTAAAPAEPCHVALMTDVELLREHTAEPGADIQQLASAWIARFAAKPFRLAEEPPVRFGIVDLSPSKHVLVLVFHHIAFDAWSAGIVAGELEAAYAALKSGRSVELPPLACQYVDVSRAERRQLRTLGMADHAEYWRRQLEGMSTLELPTDRSRHERLAQNAGVACTVLEKSVLGEIDGTARSLGVTRFIILLTAFAMTLRGYANQDDVVIGSSVANRREPRTLGLIGPFINTLVLRANLRGYMTVRQAIACIRDVVVGALDHQEFQFDQLVRDLKVVRDGRRHPLFQHAFVLDDTPVPSIRLDGLDLSAEIIHSQVSAYDLFVVARNRGDELAVTAEYSADLFDAQTIEALLRCFATVASQINAALDTRIDHIGLLADQDRNRMLMTLNGRTNAVVGPTTVAEMFEGICRRAPEAVAAKAADQCITYRELNRRANCLAHYLVARGIGPEAVVAIVLDRTFEFLITMFGILKTGAAFVPIDPDYPAERVQAIFEDCRPLMVVTSGERIGQVPPGAHSVMCMDELRGLESNAAGDLQPRAVAGSLAYIMYTSGSTGRPKGVSVTHGGVVNLSQWQRRFFDLSRRCMRISQFSSVGFDGAIGEIVMALLNGGSLIFVDRDHWSPQRLEQILGDEQIDVAVFVPSVLQLLDPRKIHRVRDITIVSVGESCLPDLASRWAGQCRFVNGYGPTETTVYSHAHVVRTGKSLQDARVPVGEAMQNMSGYVLDGGLNPLPAGAVGELYLTGMGLARGYHGRPATTAEQFVPNPLAKSPIPTRSELSIPSARDDINAFATKYVSAEPARQVPAATAHLMDLVLHEVSDVDLRARSKKLLPAIIRSGGSEGFLRYLAEGFDGRYSSSGITAEVVQHLLGLHELADCSGVDFGFGSGEVVEALARQGARVKGLDFVPQFVQRARDRGLEACLVQIDAPGPVFRADSGIEPHSQDFVLSTLVLDRVADPAQLLRNMFESLRAGGRFAIQTLLPLVPSDDEPSANPQVEYTDKRRRILNGNSEDEDYRDFVRILEKFGAGGIRTYSLPYVVLSMDGLQSYRISSFAGEKRADIGVQDGYERLYRTGDRARYRSDGTIEVCGRADEQVKIRGCRIELGDVVAALRAHADVVDAAVVAAPGPGNELRLVAHVVYRADMKDEDPASREQDIRRHLERRLPKFMQPSHVLLVDRLPRLPSGKIDLNSLTASETALPSSPLPEGEAAQTTLEDEITQCCCAVLRREHVGRDDNVFELGADSIMIVQIVARLRRRGIDVSVDQVFSRQTVAGIAAVAKPLHTDGDREEEDRVAKVQSKPATFPLTPIQRWLFERTGGDIGHDNQAVLLTLGAFVDPSVVADAVRLLVSKHVMLRLRIMRQEGGWEQSWSDTTPADVFEYVDLRDDPDPTGRLSEISRRIQSSLEPQTGAVARFVLLNERGRMRILAVVHHLAIDLVSWRVLIEDLSALLIPGVPDESNWRRPDTTYCEWARYLQSRAEGNWLSEQFTFWEHSLSAARPAAWLVGSEPMREQDTLVQLTTLGVNETAALEEIALSRGVQLEDVVLSAFAIAQREVTGEESLLIDCESHGRQESPAHLDVDRTVGWFAMLFPVLLRIDSDKAGWATVGAVNAQRRDFQSHGLAYGLFSGVADLDAELRKLPAARIGFNHLGRVDAGIGKTSIISHIERAPSSNRGAHKRRHYALDVTGYVQQGALHVELRSASKDLTAVVEQIAARVDAILRELSAAERRSERAGCPPIRRQITPIQHGMLLHCLAAPESGVYLNQLHFRIRGDLDIQRFQAAWTAVLSRHEALRAGFVWQTLDEPAQVVAENVELPISVLDWRGRDEREQQRALEAWLIEDRRRGFALDTPPLMRLSLIELGDNNRLMIWTFHHVLIDGWSVAIVLKEILAFYETASPRVRPTAACYSEQMKWAVSQSARDRREFWRSQLSGANVMPSLPIDGGPKIQAPSNSMRLPGECAVALDSQANAELIAFCRQNGLTLNTLVVAAWAMVLSHYVGTQAVLFGVTMSGRGPDMPGLDDAVGMFINTVPLSLKIDGSSVVLDWLHEVQERQVSLQEAQYTPLAQIVEWLEFPRGHQPINSVILYENYPIDASLKSGTTGPMIDGLSVIQQSNYPISIVAKEEGTLTLRVGYDASRFLQSDMRRLTEHLRLALGALATGRDRRLREITWLTSEEREVLQAFVGAASHSQSPHSRSDGCIQDLFEEQCRIGADAVAVRDGDHSLTYGALSARANVVANHLIGLGVGPEVVVGLCVDRSIAMYVGLLSILKAGGAYMPLDPKWPATRRQSLIAQAQARLVLTERRVLDVAEIEGVHFICLDDLPHQLDRSALWTPRHRAVAGNLAYVMFTSGSTGTPKGVLGTHEATLNCFDWMWRDYPFMSGEVCCQKTSFSFGDSIQEIFGPLLAGIPSVIASDDIVLDPARFTDLLASHGVTRLVLVPSLLRLMLESVDDLAQRAPKLSHWLASGEVLAPDLARAFVEKMPCCRLINMYGASELSNDVTAFEVPPAFEENAVVPIGRPIANMSVRVLDDQGEQVATRVIGKVHVSGPGLNRGYLSQPALTSNTFVPDPFGAVPGQRTYRTGDLGYVDMSGQLAFAGRADHQVKIRGIRIELGEVAAALEEHEGVEQAVVVIDGGRSDDRRLMAVVTPTRTQRLLRSPSCYVLSNGMPVLHHHRSETDYSYEEIFVDRVYARHGIDVQPGGIVVDIGANIGMFTLFAHYEFGARVFAFEPAPESFDLLRKNIELHGCNASALQVGCGERDGSRAFTFYPRSSLTSGFYADRTLDEMIFVAVASGDLLRAGVDEQTVPHQVASLAAGRLATRELNVQVRALSALMKEWEIASIDLLKLDVERSELDVLYGIADADWRRIRQIVVEVEDRDRRLDSVATLLRERGYVVAAERSERFEDVMMYTVYARRDAGADAPRRMSSPRGRFPAYQELDGAALRSSLKSRLPHFMIPASVHVVDSFPRTASGKIDRTAVVSLLRDLGAAAKPNVVPLESEMDHVVAAVWQDLLGIPAVGRDQNFFEVGGHSLMMIRVCNELTRRTNRAVSIVDLYRCPTIGELAQHLESPETAPNDDTAANRGLRRAAAHVGARARA